MTERKNDPPSSPEEGNTPNSYGVAQIIAADQELTKLFVNNITTEIDRRVQARSTHRVQVVGIFVAIGATVIGSAGFFGIDSAIKTSVNEQVEVFSNQLITRVDTQIDNVRINLTTSTKTQINEEVSSALKGEISGLREQIRLEGTFQQLNYQALSLDIKDSFSDTERDTVMSQLETIANAPVFLERAEFPTILGKIIASFAAAQQNLFIERIDDLFGGRLIRYRSVVETLVLHFGQILVGSLEEPTLWSNKTTERFTRYADAAIGHNFPELAIVMRILIESRKARLQRNAVTDALFQEVGYLNQEDQAGFIFRLIIYKDPEHWQKQATGDGARIGKIASAVYSSYENEILALLEVDEELVQRLFQLAVSYSEQSPVLAKSIITLLQSLQDNDTAQ